MIATRAIPVSTLVLAIALAFGTVALGQKTTANIEGIVTDPQGSAISGAKVTARNMETNLERSTFTNERGIYAIQFLPIGTYELTIEAQGFQPEVRRNIVLRIDQTLRLDVELRVGAVTETVTITAAPPLTDTTTTTVGEIIENRRIVELPLNGRNFMQLALLSPNVAPQEQGGNGGFDTASTGNVGFIASGARNDQNNYLIDGIPAIDHYFNVPTVTPSIEAIQEFRVLQASYSTEAGMFGGGQVYILTKSGTNEFHGSLFEFVRNDKFDAKNFFDLPDRPIPAFRQNNFGGSFGGPIIKDRTFFFFTYEGLRIRKEETTLSALFTENERRGLFENPVINPETGRPFPTVTVGGKTFYQVPIAPIARTIIDRFFPVPNLRPSERGLNHVSVAKRIEDRDQIVARLDHQFGPRQQFFARYIWARGDQSLPFGDNILTFDPPPPPGFPTPIEDDTQHLAIGLTSTVTNSVINELRLGWSFYDGKRLAANQDVNFARLNGVNQEIARRDRGFPAFTVPGLSQFGDSDVFNPLFRKNNEYVIRNNLVWTKGRHILKFGGDYHHVRFDTLSNFFTRGFVSFASPVSVTGDPRADFLLDRPASIVKLQGDTTGNFRTNLFGVFFHDEYRATSRLTLNYGLRYEVFPPIYEINNRLAVFDQFTGEIILAGDRLPPEINGRLVTEYNTLLRNLGLPPVRFVTSQSRGLGRSVTKTDFRNLAPRFGLVWDVFGTSRTVLRAGYGIYNALRDWSASSDSRNLLPFTAQLVLIDFARFGLPLPPLRYADAYGPLSDPHNIPISGISPQVDLPIGYVQSYTLNVQQQLTPNMMVEIAYVGSTGINLNRLTTGNPADFRTGARPVPNFSFYIMEASGATSTYHGGYVRMERRLSQGLLLVASYTLAKAIDTVSSAREEGGAPTREQDPRCLRCERGRANFDVRHRFVGSFLYELPFGRSARGGFGKLSEGWQIGGIITLHSGQPLTPQHPTGSPPGFRFPRPDVRGNPNLPPGQRRPHRWFDTSVFTAPPGFLTPAGFEALPGTAGRNIIDGPGFAQIDAILQKTTKVSEDVSLQFRMEVFNLFNHPNFNLPDRVFIPGPDGRNVNPNFGVITTAKNSRQIQFGLKLIF
ncbi:MAG: TonB-dependent receptor [Candidatus Caldarchaeum sp.]